MKSLKMAILFILKDIRSGRRNEEKEGKESFGQNRGGMTEFLHNKRNDKRNDRTTV